MNEVLVTANEGFAARLTRVGPDDWSRPTPCSKWDVRALVNHVIGANVRYDLLLHGATLDEVEATRQQDLLGDDPLEAFDTTAATLVDAFRDPGVLDRAFRHVTGDRTGRELLAMRILDVGIHTWDLARAIGAEESIDPGVVALALYAQDDPASAQDRLLVRSGRQPANHHAKELQR